MWCTAPQWRDRPARGFHRRSGAARGDHDPGLSAAVPVGVRPTARGPATGTYILSGNDGRGYVRVSFTGPGS